MPPAPDGADGAPSAPGRAYAGPRSGRSWRQWAADAAVLFGLAGLAITQPVLDLFGRNPTFFVAGGYGPGQIVAFALMVGFLPAAVVFAASAVPGMLGRHMGDWLHGVAVAGFAGLFTLVVCRSWGIDQLWAATGAALAVGVVVAVIERRVRVARQFLSYLALGNVAFVLLFLFGSPAAELLQGTSYADAGSVKVPPLEGPVVVVVLDEFPLPSLIRGDGSINDVRYPNFAALAGESTWFRNAASESHWTHRSVPEILTGVRTGDDDLPFVRDHPRNYFTLFGGRYPVSRYEVVTDLCPPDACARAPGESLRQALGDASVVYRHRALPEDLRDGLPDIDHSWGDFGGGLAGEASPSATTVPTTPSGAPSSPGGRAAARGPRPRRPARCARTPDRPDERRSDDQLHPRVGPAPPLRADALGRHER